MKLSKEIKEEIKRESEEYLNEKIDAYLAFTEIIKQRGLDPADFSFYLGGWITSFVITNEKRAKGQE